MRAQPTVDELIVADPPERWRAAGFRVEGDACEVGTVRIAARRARASGAGSSAGRCAT